MWRVVRRPVDRKGRSDIIAVRLRLPIQSRPAQRQGLFAAIVEEHSAMQRCFSFNRTSAVHSD